MSASRSTDQGIVINRDYNITPVLQIITWFLLCINILSVLTRTRTKLIKPSTWKLDDFFVLLALILSIGQSIATSLQDYNGYGRHLVNLDKSETDAAQKADFAANLLYIGGLWMTKLTIAALLWNLSPYKLDRRQILYGAIFIGVWSTSSLLVIAFQCSVPRTWELIGGACINTTAFWIYYGVVNLATDLMLVIFPIRIIWRIQMSTQKRVNVCLFFSFRLCTIGAIICQLVFIRSSPPIQEDPTFNTWKLIICREVVLSTSLLASCMPQFKVVMTALESGMIHVDDFRRRGQTGLHGYTGASKDTANTSPKQWPYSDLSRSAVSTSNKSASCDPGTIHLQTDISVTEHLRGC